ncbi:carboxylesterase/lipase family protein [Parvularcula marina]|uniref:carboxylesterase/lipase family protein n=1 Tax=Parvularcula marina TaxID=2292771 RepID=UPI00351914F3
MNSVRSHRQGRLQGRGWLFLSLTSRKSRSFILALGLAGLIAGGAAQAADAPVVTVEQGEMAGTQSGGIRSFKGVPFAAPPVGELRWAPTEPAASWGGVLDASAYGAACLQPEVAGRPSRVTTAQSEDCLTLNIWAPEGAEDAPVMVWIHGGAFRIGSGSLPYYDGTAFAERGIVLVTINYRMGGYGFFAHPALVDENGGGATNFGLLDQIEALEWVHANIGAFGGNPNNVTVFGESAGGASVLYLLTSPLTKGLFSKAIVQSGGGSQQAACAWAECGGKSSASSQGVVWAADQGLEDPTAEELRALPAEAILSFAPLSSGMGFGPMIDGEVITGNVLDRIGEGVVSDISVIIGSNSNESSVLAAFGQSPERAAEVLGAGLEMIRGVYTQDRELTDEELSSEIMRDAIFGAPARRAAVAMQAKGLPVWRYYYDYVMTRRRENSLGANHGAEIPMVFGTISTVPLIGRLATDEDREHSRMMNEMWANFAIHGAPSIEGEVDWPAIDAEANPALVINGTGAHLETDFQKATLDLQDRLAAMVQGRAETKEGN